jgi:hypothetical protein
MIFFLTFARIVRIAYITLRAAAGILILSHGINRWAQAKLR